ncbi:MAG: hypothetical protein K8S97_10585, partial [Anaerolineae bacterium]|nr:hypothetical protein [Anaerolineae bacterium]
MHNPMTPRRPLHWHPSIDVLRAAIPPDETAYLVGGAVRDAYLHRLLHDIDLATPGDGRPLARHIANTFKGAYYSLDRERGVGRALIPWETQQLTIDVAQFRGPNLLTDLQLRDFTLNAMAVDLTGDLQAVIDPLGGLNDLDAKRLRQCSPDAIANDPIRALRAVRASVTFKLMIEAHTRESIRTHAETLTTTSPERIRDEFFQILNGARPASALVALHHLGLLAQIVPATRAMPGVTQSPPHQFDVWEHTLKTVAQLDVVLHLIAPHRSHDLTMNIQAGAVATAFNPLRDALREHLTHQWPNKRSHRALLILAALLHDSGKPLTRNVDDA